MRPWLGGAGSNTWHRGPPTPPCGSARWRRPARAAEPVRWRLQVATLIDQVELRELQPHAVVADREVLVNGLDALLVSRARELLALALLDLLGATDEGEEALALLGANGGYREE